MALGMGTYGYVASERGASLKAAKFEEVAASGKPTSCNGILDLSPIIF